MSFSSSFGTQVAAIMDVLAKAAVAEITKLVENGTVVLRLEMCRKDGEIQELKRSLKLMELELCKAREAALSRAPENAQEQTADGRHVDTKDEKEDEETQAVSLEPMMAEPLCESPRGTQESCDFRSAMKHEQETMDNSATAETCFEAREGDEPIWPPPACTSFDKTPVPMLGFASHSEQYGTYTENCYNSLSTDTEGIADESLGGLIKVEVDIQPTCMGSTAPECAHDEPFRPDSYPAVSQDQQSASRKAVPFIAPPHAQRSSADRPHADSYNLGRNNPKAKRLTSVWRASQKLFACSACSRGFPRLSQLEEHKATHQPLKPFMCLECGKSFTQKTRLKTHQSVHTGERPFSCKICGKMFSRQDNCLRHERFHSGLKPYSCGQCGKSFTVLGNLKIHQEIHKKGR